MCLCLALWLHLERTRRSAMIVYTKPMYGNLPTRKSEGAWPRVVTGQAKGSLIEWTVVWDNGTHAVGQGGVEVLRAADPELTMDVLRAYYTLSRQVRP